MDDLLPTAVFGLPLHPLLVHATVVLVPLTSLLVLLTTLAPRVRAWAGWLPLLMAAGCAVLTPLSTSSGENLQRQQGGGSELVRKHAELAGWLIYWVVGLLVVAAASYALQRSGRDRTTGVAVALMVVGVVIPVGTLVQTVLIGHSGAKAVWNPGAAAAVQDRPSLHRGVA